MTLPLDRRLEPRLLVDNRMPTLMGKYKVPHFSGSLTWACPRLTSMR